MSATLVKVDRKKLLLVMANNVMSFPDLGKKQVLALELYTD